MALKTAVINNWENGIAPAPRRGGLREDGSPVYPFAGVWGVDPYRIPGLAVPGLDFEDISESVVVDWPIEAVDASGNIWMLGDAGNIYKITSSDVVTKDHTSSNPEGRGLTLHHDGTAKYLYYRSANEIGRFDLASTYNDNYITSLNDNGTGVEAPLVSYIGNLYFANGGYIGRKVAGGTENSTFLTLPLDHICKQIIKYGEFLLLNCRTTIGDVDSQRSKFIVWNGIKPDYQEEIDLPGREYTVYNDDNLIRLWLGTRNARMGYLSGRRFVGERRINWFQPTDSSTAESSRSDVIRNGSIVKVKNQLVFGTRSESGLLTYDSQYPELPAAINKPYYLGTNEGFIGSMFYRESLDRLYVGYKYGSTYKIGRFSTGYQSGATHTTPVLNFGTRRKKYIAQIRLYNLTHAEGNSIEIQVKKDGGSFTSLFTSSYASDGAVDEKYFNWETDSTAREYEFKVIYTTTGSAVGVYSIEIDWDYASESNRG